MKYERHDPVGVREMHGDSPGEMEASNDGEWVGYEQAKLIAWKQATQARVNQLKSEKDRLRDNTARSMLEINQHIDTLERNLERGHY